MNSESIKSLSRPETLTTSLRMWDEGENSEQKKLLENGTSKDERLAFFYGDTGIGLSAKPVLPSSASTSLASSVVTALPSLSGPQPLS